MDFGLEVTPYGSKHRIGTHVSSCFCFRGPMGGCHAPDPAGLVAWNCGICCTCICAFTVKVAKGGSLVLRALKYPFRPISANKIGVLTKILLLRWGVSTSMWGSHSTRGAGVRLYKALGLPSEGVCEIGCEGLFRPLLAARGVVHRVWEARCLCAQCLTYG